MRHFRKKPSSQSTPTHSRPPTPTPPVERARRELATFSRAKDQRVLAALPVAVALSCIPPSSDFKGAAPDEPGPSKESSLKRVYGAARMVVEAAKESSDMCLPLKAVAGVLSVLIKNCDQTIANVGQITDIEERIQSLGEALSSPVGEQDVEEKARREVLRNKLEGIMARLGQLSEQHGFLKFLNNVDHTNILNGFVQDLGYVITDYQTSLQQSIYENTKGIEEVRSEARRIGGTVKRIDQNAQNIIEAAELELLAKLNPVHNAGYQAGHHDTCLRGTRESVLDGIIGWAKDPQEKRVFWLNGLAGTGKSTIAQTFSQVIAQDGTLGASFFCSRDYLDRRELKNIFPTLAYQLACRYTSFRSQIIEIVKKDPSIARNSLVSQLQELIINPLSSTDTSCVIVIDALDECIDDQSASAILSVLGRYAKELSSVKLFITGRPEPRIRRGFRLPLLVPLTQIFLLHGVELSSVDEDIRLYLQEKLSTIAKRSGLDLSDPWPCNEDLKTLTKKSSGLFIFASTLAKFIESKHHEPNERLQLIVHAPDRTFHEGQAGIDPLYTQVLMQAFSDVKDTTVFANFRRVLGAVVLAFNPLSRIQIAEILGINPSLIATTLQHLHSVLLVPKEGSKDIRIFHKSFPDFLQDGSRCSESKFFIDSTVHHADIAFGCLELLKKLKPNPCDLPDFVMNRDVADLPGLLGDKVGSATRYACGYWAMHVRSSPTTEDHATQLVASATEFFKNNTIPWIEVMSLENRLENVIYGIYGLLDWIGKVDVPTSDLRSLAQDCLRFTTHFFHLIEQSAQHVYHSALPLSPASSTFCSMVPQEKSAITEFYGRADTWGAVMRTIKSSSGSFTSMTTIGHRIAAACDDGTVGIYDSITGALRLSLSPADPVQTIKGCPDGSMLFCAHQGPSVTAWDIQTGGLVHTLTLDGEVREIAICLEGRYIACGLSDGTVRIWEVSGKAEGAVFGSGSPISHLCWLESGKQLVVVQEASVQVWDVVARQVLRSSTEWGPICGVVYAQQLNKFATVETLRTGSIVTVVDPRTGRSFANRTQQRISCFAFSQITKELVFGMSTPGIELFSIPAGDWRRFNHSATITSISTLSNGTVVANVTGSGIQLLSLDEGYTPPQQQTLSALTVYALDQGNIIAVSSINPNQVALLESSTMSPLLTVRPTPTENIPIDRPTILCASLRHRVAVYHTESTHNTCLRLWKFGKGYPEWVDIISGCRVVGGLSPSGSRFVVLHEVNRTIHVRIWDVRNGDLQAHRQIVTAHPHTQPLGVEFKSEERFYSQHNTYRVLYVISSSKPAASSDPDATLQSDTSSDISLQSDASVESESEKARLDFEKARLDFEDARLNFEDARLKLEKAPLEKAQLKFEEDRLKLEKDWLKFEKDWLEFEKALSRVPVRLTIHFKKLGPASGQLGRYYNLDDTREWVTCLTKRICWIPPGYIGSGNGSHCWAGNVLVMAGHDGVLRKLTFRSLWKGRRWVLKRT